MTNLPRWTKRDNFSAVKHQGIVDAINSMLPMAGEGDLEISRTPSGQTIIHTRRDTYVVRYTGKIIEPEDTAHEYTNCRYRCQVLQVATNSDPEAFPTFTALNDQNLYPEYGIDYDDVDLNIGNTVTATNIAEYAADTHLLQEDGTEIVELYCEYDLSQPPKVRWFFSRPPSGGKLRLIRLVSESGGVWQGKLLTYSGGVFTDTGTTITNLKEVNDARGFVNSASVGTIVLVNEDDTFYGSLRLMNTTTHLGYAAGLVMHATLNTVFEFTLGAAGGSNGANIKVVGTPSLYQGVFWDGTRLIYDYVRAHS